MQINGIVSYDNCIHINVYKMYGTFVGNAAFGVPYEYNVDFCVNCTSLQLSCIVSKSLFTLI